MCDCIPSASWVYEKEVKDGLGLEATGLAKNQWKNLWPANMQLISYQLLPEIISLPWHVTQSLPPMSAVSAADVRSALSLPTPTPGPSQPRKPGPKKPEGISRELYALIGTSAPSLAATLAKPRLKQKPNFSGRGTVKWYGVPYNSTFVRINIRRQGTKAYPSSRAYRLFATLPLGKSE